MAEAGEDLVGVLTELRRWPVLGGLRRLGEVDRLADHLDIAELWMPHALGDAEMLHLRLGECLVDELIGPPGTPASFRSFTHSTLDLVFVTRPIPSLSVFPFPQRSSPL